ncbi:MAG: segregation/condensation protein A, partial [Clostridia bacterium]|nr:segregation/condensation protein A [Clostridia bacterium]
LIYIKTVSLLPVYEEAKQLKEELTGELLEYRDCKLMAQKLAQQANGFDYYWRAPMDLPVDHSYRRIHESGELLDSYINAVGRGKRKLPPPIEAFQVIVSKKIVSVSSRFVSIYRRLLKKSRARFSEFFEGATSRSQLVATFLAMLELIKANRVELSDDNETVTLNRRKREKE